MKHVKFISGIAVLALILLITSCQSVPSNVPEDLSQADIIQLAQDSYEEGNIAAAEYYYNVVIERFGTNPAAYVVATYEIAHIRVKAGKFRDAKPLLESIIECFDTEPSLAYTAPEYLKLARIDLAKCE